jgi:flagellar hook assembly protein FlgD
LNVEGKVVSNLLEDELSAGRHEVAWQATNDSGRRVAPGIYFVEVATRDKVTAAKTIVLR